MLVPLYFDLPTLDLDCCARKNSNMASKILSVICMPCIGVFPLGVGGACEYYGLLLS